ncbi:MAG TPA: hypothetical protein PLJ29_05770 [Leptospiraceae bacterium]|nr:hypothetical protein [Leptospiraceae bacterium]
MAKGFPYESANGNSGMPIRRTIPVIGQTDEEKGRREMVSPVEGSVKKSGKVISLGPMSASLESAESSERIENEEKAFGAGIEDCI